MRKSKPNANRNRSKHKFTDVFQARLKITDLSDGTVFRDIQTEPFKQLAVWRYMKDTRGFKANYFNPCYNERAFVALKPVRSFIANNFAGGALYEFHSGISEVPYGDFVESIRNIEIPDLPEYLDDFCARAEHHFKTAVDDTHSILNFLIELIEMCEGNIVKLKELVEKLKRAFDLFWKMYKKTGNYWLSWNFAIKPTIGDVKAIISSVNNARKRLRWLKKHNHLDTPVSYRQNNGFETSGTIDLPYDWGKLGHTAIATGTNPIGVKFEFVYQTKLKVAANAVVRFDIPDQFLSDEEGLGIVWLSLAGLYNPLKVAWEAIPFSWLIDWFVSIKTQMQLEAANLSPLKDATILQTGHSITTEVDGEVYLVNEDRSERMYLGIIQYRLYNRQPGLPLQELFPFRIPIGWYNISIIAALIGNKRRR
jgi:hypothetical protein